MEERECLNRMVPPGRLRPGKYRGGVIQIWTTRACDKACFGCTQGSNLAGKPGFITPAQYEDAVKSLKTYWGVVGMFGGNPALHPQFEELCDILCRYIPYEKRGIWCNHPKGKGHIMRKTFNPGISNLNVHLDEDAYTEFRHTWPECHVFGLTGDSRHAPPYVAMKDLLRIQCNVCSGNGGWFRAANGDRYLTAEPGVAEDWTHCLACDGKGTVYDEERAYELISRCDINQHWSAMVGVFRGQLRAWFCEVAGAQSMLHQEEEDYPDTGLPVDLNSQLRLESEYGVYWWQLPMDCFYFQVRQHCHDCGIPLRGYGELSQSNNGTELTTATHESIYIPKRKGRSLKVITNVSDLKSKGLKVTDYLGGGRK